MSMVELKDGILEIKDSKINDEVTKLIGKISKSCIKNKKAIEKLLNNEVVVTIAMNIEPKTIN